MTWSSPPVQDETAKRRSRVSEVVHAHMRTPETGESVSDERVLAAHPDLAPELAERLRVLRLIDSAHQRAAHGVARELPHFDGCDVVREIHRGGQGVVYEAVERSSMRVVAIKALRGAHLASERDVMRFEQEVQILNQLSHPGIVCVRSSGRVSVGFFYVMEHIDGAPLDDYLEQVDLTVREAMALFTRICQAVNAAHLKGVIHRDLKPSNILIDDAGQPHVLDFGLAKIRLSPLSGDAGAASKADQLTMTGQFIGSLPWASPEQASGEPLAIDTRSDVYALGVIAYFMLTGDFPYAVTGSMRDVLDRIVREEPQPMRILRPEIDADVETIVSKCLAKEPERRYQSAGEIARDVQRHFAGEAIEARRDRPWAHWYLLRKTMARHRFATLTAALLAMLVLGSSVTAWMMYGRQSQLRATAERNAERARSVQAFLHDVLARFNPEFARGRDRQLLLDMLDEAAERVDVELAGENEALASVLDTIGCAYGRLEMFDRAQPLLERALALRRQTLGNVHLDVAESLTHLAELLMDRGEYRAAEPLFREALEARQTLLPANDPGIARSLNDLGLAMSSNRVFDQAESLHQRALAMLRAGRGANDDADVSRTLSLIGMLRYNREDYAGALEPLEQALVANRRQFGDRSVAAAGDMINLAKLHHMTGRYDAAESMLREALDIERELLGDMHSNVAWALHRLGMVLHARGKYDEAEAALSEAVALRIRIMQPDDPYIASALNSLGDMRLDRGDFAGAEVAFIQAVEVRRRKLPADDPYLAWSGNRLGELRQMQGDLDAAEQLLRCALAQRESCGTQEHPYLARTLNSLAALLLDRGSVDEAVNLYEEALLMRRNLLGEEHPDVAQSMTNLGAALLSRGSADDAVAAEAMLRQGLALSERTLGNNHPQTAEAMTAAAFLLLDKGELAAAEAMAIGALAIQQRALTPAHPALARTQAILNDIAAARVLPGFTPPMALD